MKKVIQRVKEPPNKTINIKKTATHEIIKENNRKAEFKASQISLNFIMKKERYFIISVTKSINNYFLIIGSLYSHSLVDKKTLNSLSISRLITTLSQQITADKLIFPF